MNFDYQQNPCEKAISWLRGGGKGGLRKQNFISTKAIKILRHKYEKANEINGNYRFDGNHVVRVSFFARVGDE